jgi:hypothetical protein
VYSHKIIECRGSCVSIEETGVGHRAGELRDLALERLARPHADQRFSIAAGSAIPETPAARARRTVDPTHAPLTAAIANGSAVSNSALQ